MDNSTRRQLLDKARATGYPGSILEAFTAYDQGRDLIGEFVQQQQAASFQPPMQVAQTPEEQEQGLRPAHEAGQVDQSMAFPNVQPGQSFNTVGMKVPINIDKVDNNGNLVESYKAVPPGIQNLPTGPYEGTVIETPARMKTGGAEKDPPTKKKIYTDPDKFAEANKAYNDSLSAYNAYPIPSGLTAYNMSREEFLRDNNPAPGQMIHFHNIKNRDFANSTRINPARIEPVGDSSLGTAGFEWVYKKPTQQPVYQEKPKIAPISYREGRLELSDKGLAPITYMPPSNTAAVLSKIKEEDMYKQSPKVVRAPEFQMGGAYQTNQEISMYEWRSGLPEDSRKRYFIGGLKNRVLYNKAKYKR